MGSRTFEDSTGARWEVFEVHRASRKPQAVSAGMEFGWLSFVGSETKRRLAPFPPEWEQATDAELERLCGIARLAVVPDFVARSRPARERPDPANGGAFPESAAIARGSRLSGAQQVHSETPEMPILRPAEWAEVEHAVREFALEARATGLPAIEAMVRLKSRLLERFPGDEHAARDMRRVRRWFVEAFYFERDA